MTLLIVMLVFPAQGSGFANTRYDAGLSRTIITATDTFLQPEVLKNKGFRQQRAFAQKKPLFFAFSQAIDQQTVIANMTKRHTAPRKKVKAAEKFGVDF